MKVRKNDSKNMEINQIKQLREQTGASMIECKKALEESDGDKEKAIEILKKSQKILISKKSEEETKEGLIETYLHSNSKIGVLLEINCQTDFVAKNQEFRNLAHDLTMQIAATDPSDLKVLLGQPFIKDPTKTIGDLINEHIAKLGENIKISRFIRYQI